MFSSCYKPVCLMFFAFCKEIPPFPIEQRKNMNFIILFLFSPKTSLKPFFVRLLHNLVPRAFSSFKMADRRNPWPRLLKYSKNRGVFFHVTHDEMGFSEVVSSIWRPCLFSAIGNRCSNEMKTFHRVYVSKF